MRTQCPRVGSFLSSSTRSPTQLWPRGYHSGRRGTPPNTFGSPAAAGSKAWERRRRRPRRRGRLVLDLILELPQMLASDVDPVLLRRERGGELDVALPLRDRRFGVDLLVDEREIVHGARVLAVDLDHAPILLGGLLVEAFLLVDFAEAHPSVDGVGIELDRLLVGVDRLVVEALLAVVDLAEAHVYARIDRVVEERLLVGSDRAVGVALRGLGVAEPAVGVGVEGPQLDRLRVGLDRLIEEAPGLREVEIAEGLIRLRIARVELRRGTELRGGLPAVAERRVDDAERVRGHHEARVDLDRAREEVDRPFVALLVAAERRDLAAREELEGARHARRAGSLLDPAGLSVGRGRAQCARVREGQPGEPAEHLARGRHDRLEARDLRAARLDVHQLGHDRHVRAAALEAAEESGVGANTFCGLCERRLGPRVRAASRA